MFKISLLEAFPLKTNVYGMSRLQARGGPKTPCGTKKIRMFLVLVQKQNTQNSVFELWGKFTFTLRET